MKITFQVTPERTHFIVSSLFIIDQEWGCFVPSKRTPFPWLLKTSALVFPFILSWFTKAKKVNSHFRNIDVEQLSDHLHGLPFDFVSLQYGLSKKEIAKINSNIQLDILSVNELDLFNDIDGLASLIAACDIVVSVDNINVHLAGALGVDTRVILPKVADERWGLGEEESYLYDSIKIYRQTNSED